MPRPKKERLVNTPPLFNSFKPTGVARSELKRIVLSLDEFEALRLADFKDLEHTEAAELMEISRSTFTRLIDKARKKTAAFVMNGGELAIEGGNIHFRDNILKCNDCEHMFRISFGDEFSTCPSCGSENLIDMAGGYGHGQCCVGRNNHGGHGHGHGGHRN